MRTTFKIVLFLLSFIPLYYGCLGLFFGAALANEDLPVSAAMDNQYRYVCAYYLSLAAFTWWVLADIDDPARVTVFRIAIGFVFLGGLARAYSYLTVGTPAPTDISGMYLELIAPILLYFHTKIAKSPGPAVP